MSKATSPKALLIKGQVIRFTPRERQLIAMKAANSGAFIYEASKEVALSSMRAAKHLAS